MASAILESLNCAICFEQMEEPKQLSCGHSFCLDCLSSMNRRGANLNCPTCRKATPVPQGNVANLPTNFVVKNLVEDLKKPKVKDEPCTANCEPTDRSAAVTYCQTCGVYMCQACHVKHKEWKKNATHDVVRVEEIRSGKVKINPTRSSVRDKAFKLEGLPLVLPKPTQRPAPKTAPKPHGVNLAPLREDAKHKLAMKREVPLSTKNSMDCLAGFPNGKVAVGSLLGGVEVYSTDGRLEQRVQRKLKVQAIAFLTNDRFVVRDDANKTCLYQSWGRWHFLGVRFETIPIDKGGFGGLAVNREDRIFMNYRTARKIQVFNSAWPRAIKEIACDGYIPMQIAANNFNTILIVVTGANAVSVVNATGDRLASTVIEGADFIVSSVCRDETILIAALNVARDRVSIRRYNRDLGFISSILDGHALQKTHRAWHCMQELVTGEVALCSTDRLYLFHKALPPQR